MNERERFVATLKCEKVDRPPFFPMFGPWDATLERWEKEGVKKEERHKNVGLIEVSGLGEEVSNWMKSFGFDNNPHFTSYINLGFCPKFEYEVIEDLDDCVIVRDEYGIIKKDRKDGKSMPQFLEHPVKNMGDWEKLKKERLNPDSKERFPENWNEIAKKLKSREFPAWLGYFPYGVFGTARDILGAEELLISFYTQPELIHDIMNYLTDMWIRIWEKAARKVQFDVVHLWEDMSGKQGSLISPETFKKFMAPCYEKVVDFAGRYKIPLVSVDTDGDCHELAGIFSSLGVNLLWPLEVQAGNDVIEYRKKYPKLGIIGGIDKNEIAKGKEAIESELERITPAIREGGYIPTLDHNIPPNISWNDYTYYTFKLKEIIGKKS